MSMKKSVAIAAAAVVMLLVLIAAVKDRLAEQGGPVQATESAERQNVRQFWQAYNRASGLRAQEDFAGALIQYRRALELDPGHEESMYYAATSLYELGDYAQAEAILHRLLQHNPQSGRGWSQLGRTLAEVAPGGPADYAAAEEAYRRSLDINREQAGPFLQLGLLELNQGRWGAAAEAFHTASLSGSPEGTFLLGYSRLLQNRLGEAARAFRQVIDAHLANKKITSQGVLSEGDVLAPEGKPLSPAEHAAVKSMLFLYWTELRAGKTPEAAAAEIHRPPLPASPTWLKPVGKLATSGARGAWGDFDADGWPDLAVGGTGLILLRNRGGQLVDVTAAAGLGQVRDAWSAVWVDVDGDGRLDLYVLRPGFRGRGSNQLFRNTGQGSFRDVTRDSGLGGTRSTIAACLLDADGDGRTDLIEVGAAGEGDSAVRLFRNNGHGFESQSVPGAQEGTAVDCAVADYDGDGKGDLLVHFWRRGVRLYRNSGAGKFVDATREAGMLQVGRRGMASVFLDYNRDGLPDLLVSSLATVTDVARSRLGFHCGASAPQLWQNLGGKFREVTAEAGLDGCYGTVQALAADMDQDGWTDLVLVNGGPDMQRLEPTVVLRNLEGRSFQEWRWYPEAGEPGNLLGAAAGDLNGDGRPDLYLASHLLLRQASRGGIFLNVARHTQ